MGRAAPGHLCRAAGPGRIDPGNSAFNASRKPLAGEFSFNGRHLFAIANHFNSKGGDQPLFGRFQPPTRVTEAQRHQQAQIVHDFAASLEAADPDANVVVLGDLNDFEFSDALSTLRAGVLHDLIETLPQGERYTYDFEGNSQTLDHILLSDALFADHPFAYDAVHVNSEFAGRQRPLLRPGQRHLHLRVEDRQGVGGHLPARGQAGRRHLAPRELRIHKVALPR